MAPLSGSMNTQNRIERTFWLHVPDTRVRKRLPFSASLNAKGGLVVLFCLRSCYSGPETSAVFRILKRKGGIGRTFLFAILILGSGNVCRFPHP